MLALTLSKTGLNNMHVMILGSWSDCVGTDYCEYLGEYDSLEQAEGDANTRAWETWEPQNDEEEDDGFDEEDPNYWIEEYDPEKHDMLKAGGGSWKVEIL